MTITTTTNTEKKGHAGAIAVIIFFMIIIAFFVGYVWYTNVDMEERLADGCEPKAWNQWGQPTIWSCPIGAGNK